MHAELGLGKIIEGDAVRDAIHVAVAPAIAGEPLQPGTHVGIDATGVARCSDNPVGIVDPFLNVRHVQTHKKFWLFLYPNTVTGMRHHWQHPAFSGAETPPASEPSLAESEAWLRAYAVRHNSYIDDPEEAYQHLLQNLRQRGIYFRGSNLHGLYELDDSHALKEHGERVLGITINWGEFEFSCSC